MDNQLAADNARPELERIVKFIDDYFAPWGSWKTAWWEGEVSDDAAFSDGNALKHVANKLRVALAAPPPQPQQVQYTDGTYSREIEEAPQPDAKARFREAAKGHGLARAPGEQGPAMMMDDAAEVHARLEGEQIVLRELREALKAERDAAAASFNVYWTEGAEAAKPLDERYRLAKECTDALLNASQDTRKSAVAVTKTHATDKSDPWPFTKDTRK
jgi:hypothetical protein